MASSPFWRWTRPSVSEIAEKVKTLKAAHNIEATPRRARQKQSAAEEPITARIQNSDGYQYAQ